MGSLKPDAFQVGPFEVARSPDVHQLAEKLNRLREAVDQCRLQNGVGYTVTRSSGGTSLSIRGGQGSASQPETSHPWKVTLDFDSRQGGYGFRTEPESRLEANYQPGRPEGVRGLGEFVPFGTRQLQETWYCVLQLSYDEDLFVTEALLTGVKKSVFSGVIVPASGPQAISNTILATIRQDGTVVQGVQGDLYVALVNRMGFPALLPVALLEYPALSVPPQ